MSPERIRQLLETQPFRPFVVHTGDGSTVRVLARDHVLLAGRTLFVATGRRRHDDADVEIIDIFLITKVTTTTGNGRRGHGPTGRR